MSIHFVNKYLLTILIFVSLIGTTKANELSEVKCQILADTNTIIISETNGVITSASVTDNIGLAVIKSSTIVKLDGKPNYTVIQFVEFAAGDKVCRFQLVSEPRIVDATSKESFIEKFNRVVLGAAAKAKSVF